MPYSVDSPPDAFEGLPKGALEIGVAAFNAAYKDACAKRSDREGCAFKIAWSAIGKKYKKEGDQWVAKSALVEVDLIITKATLQADGTMRWQAVASDTDPDGYGERASLGLFQDWIQRVEIGKTADFLPPPHMPFLGVSHYPFLDGYGEGGITERMFIDGNRFKPDGQFTQDNPIGPALFEAVRSEREMVKRGQVVELPIRISAAWWDLEHSHGSFVFTRRSLTDVCPMCAQGVGDKVYLKGQLDHFAVTRVPVNPRTSLELEEKSMSKKTRRDDAASIVGDELADELEGKAQTLVGKAETEEEAAPALVVKADEEAPDVQRMDGMGEEHEYRPLGGATSLAGAESYIQAQEMMDRLYTNWDLFRVVVGNILGTPGDADKQAALSRAVKEFGDRVDTLKAGVTDAYLVALAQVSPAAPASPATPAVAEKGDIDMSEQTSQPGAAQATPNDPAATLAVAIKAALENPQLAREGKSQAIQEALNTYVGAVKAQLDAVAPPAPGEEVAQAVKAALQPIVDKLGLLEAKLGERLSTPAAAPVQKSFQPGPAPVQQPAPRSSLRAAIRQSVGIVE